MSPEEQAIGILFLVGFIGLLSIINKSRMSPEERARRAQEAEWRREQYHKHMGKLEAEKDMGYGRNDYRMNASQRPQSAGGPFSGGLFKGFTKKELDDFSDWHAPRVSMKQLKKFDDWQVGKRKRPF